MTAISWRLSPRNGLIARHRRLALLLRTPSVLASVLWLAIVVIFGTVVAPLVTEVANRQVLTDRLTPPFGLSHGLAGVLGTDPLGRPMLLQLIVGARTSLIIAICAVGVSAIIGTTIGVISGYFGGWVDAILMRLADILHTVPSLLLALVVLYVLQPSLINLILVLGVTRIPVYLRTSRAQVMELRERTFVESAHAIGSGPSRIMALDLAPLVLPTIGTLAMLEVATVILSAAGLSFLGVGLQRPNVDWGIMVSDGKAYLTDAWWVTVLPGLAIVLTALAANIISNWFRAVDNPLHGAPVPLRRHGRQQSSTSAQVES